MTRTNVKSERTSARRRRSALTLSIAHRVQFVGIDTLGILIELFGRCTVPVMDEISGNNTT